MDAAAVTVSGWPYGVFRGRRARGVAVEILGAEELHQRVSVGLTEVASTRISKSLAASPRASIASSWMERQSVK
jgi:hypothetical protein